MNTYKLLSDTMRVNVQYCISHYQLCSKFNNLKANAIGGGDRLVEYVEYS